MTDENQVNETQESAPQEQQAPIQPTADQMRAVLVQKFSEKYHDLCANFAALPINPKLKDFAAMNLDQGFGWVIQAINMINFEAPDVTPEQPINAPEQSSATPESDNLPPVA